MPQICCPEPFTVNVPLAKVALPAKPTRPTSPSDQSDGRPPFTIAVTVSVNVVEFIKVPDAPVIVTEDVPVVAVLVAVKVTVLEPVAGLGLNDAVTPVGSPEADKLTLPLNPFCGATLIALVLVAAWATLLGDAESVKFGPALTINEIVALLAKLPDVPVTVTVTVPVVAVLVAVKVSVLEAVAGLGLKDAVTPLGNPEADRLTLALKPFCGITVTVLVPLVPCAMLKLFGEAERV